MSADSIMNIIMLIVIFIAVRAGYYEGYKKGQIDSMTGKIKYKLVEYPDGEKLWTRV